MKNLIIKTVDNDSIESIFQMISVISLTYDMNWENSYNYFNRVIGKDLVSELCNKIYNILNDLNNYKLHSNIKIDSSYRIIFDFGVCKF